MYIASETNLEDNRFQDFKDHRLHGQKLWSASVVKLRIAQIMNDLREMRLIKILLACSNYSRPISMNGELIVSVMMLPSIGIS